MSKTGYGNWKGPFKDAVKGEDYVDTCPPGTYLVRGYRRSDGAEVPAYCKKMSKKESREPFKIRESTPDRSASEFGDDYTMVESDYNRDDILQFAGIPKSEREDFTGLFVKLGDGEYKEIWGTRSSFPYSLNASYERLK